MSTGDRPGFMFPNPESAGPDGLLAAGGDLSPETLVTAYANGIFPWYNEGQPILWWCPDPRTVLRPDSVHISRSLGKRIRNAGFRITLNTAFAEVIHHCADSRKNHPDGGTWITKKMESAYTQLHEIGIAHSVEAWQGEELAGGLYGVSLGRMFFGESMFSLARDASKVALVALCRHLVKNGFPLIDCQVSSEHIHSMGAIKIPRTEFLAIVRNESLQQVPAGVWTTGELSLSTGDSVP